MTSSDTAVSPGNKATAGEFGFMAGFSQQAIEDWEERKDVLLHFQSIHWFAHDLPEGWLDLVNLEDADVLFFNRSADMTRGLKNPQELAKYLRDFSSTHKEIAAGTTTLRTQLISHVYHYNLKQRPRRRFFMVGLSSEELKFLNGLNLLTKSKLPTGVVKSETERAAGWATDGILEASGKGQEVKAYEYESFVQAKVAECLGLTEEVKAEGGEIMAGCGVVAEKVKALCGLDAEKVKAESVTSVEEVANSFAAQLKLVETARNALKHISSVSLGGVDKSDKENVKTAIVEVAITPTTETPSIPIATNTTDTV